MEQLNTDDKHKRQTQTTNTDDKHKRQTPK